MKAFEGQALWPFEGAQLKPRPFEEISQKEVNAQTH
jgi:hypothetical protein